VQNPRILAILFVDAIILAVGLSNLPRLAERPRAPFTVQASGGRAVIADILDPTAAGGLREGDVLASWNGLPLGRPEMIELLGDMSNIGSQARIGTHRRGAEWRVAAILTPYYPTMRYAVITTFTSLIFWLIGVFVLLRSPGDGKALLMHWALVAGFATVVLTTGRIDASDAWSYVLRSGFFFGYNATWALLLLFATEFPRRMPGNSVVRFCVIFAFAAALSIFLVITHSRAMIAPSVEAFNLYQFGFDALHLVFAAAVLSAGGIFAVAAFGAKDPSEKNKILLIAGGMFAGILPFVLLSALPQLWSTEIIISEEFTTIFLLAIPFSLMLAFLRYREMNVEVESGRRSLRAVLSSIVWSAYVLLIFVVASVIRGPEIFDESFWDVAEVLMIAVALIPARKRFQRFLDDTLFPARYRFGHILRDLADGLREQTCVQGIAGVFGSVCIDVLVAEKAVVYLRSGKSVFQSADSAPELSLTADSVVMESFRRSMPVASAGTVAQTAVAFDFSSGEWLDENGMSICVPLLDTAHEVIGCAGLAFGKSAGALRREEVDLLMAAAEQTAQAIDRLRLQEKVIKEREERRRMEEVDRMRSSFVSAVTHELKTPLTSISMFAETLREGRIDDERKKSEYLDIIEGEAGRLSRLIDNVLGFSKIERNSMRYRFAPVDIAPLLRRTFDSMAYQFRSENADAAAELPERLPEVNADPEAIQQLVINLLTNALKYARNNAIVRLIADSDDASVAITVKDNGIGISDSELERIFDPFYRSPAASASKAGGAGLGLALVRSIVDAHGGGITVISEVGKGSSFVVRLPAAGRESAEETS